MPNPIAIQIGPLAVHWYGLMYVLAFALFIALGRVRIRQPHIAALGWKKEDLDDMLFYGMLGVVIGVWCARWYSKKKAGKHRMYVVHIMYWYLPSEIVFPFPSLPPSSTREFIG